MTATNSYILKKVKRVMFIILIIVSCVIFTLAAILLAYSNGKPKPFLDKNGNVLANSISEKIFIDIYGVKQGMFIKSKDKSQPVLLYLHGGMPDYFLTKKYPTGLENFFTVVWWEQRGSGISFNENIPSNTLTIEQMIADTHEITKYLCKRFEKKKIYLMGHSGGTFIGIQAAAKAPQLYHAYIGVAQMSNQLKSEIEAYEYMIQQYKMSGDNYMVKSLQATPITAKDGIPDAYKSIRDKAMHQLGIGTTRDIHSVESGIFFPSLACSDYTIIEKINTWKGKSKSGISILWNDMLTSDMALIVSNIDIPIYFLHGKYDYTVSYTQAKEYFKKIKSPVKGFYTFENSAHSPIFEEPENTQRIIRNDILNGTNKLADSK